jgi:2C-methyl-D-erythritol 2,4-cyclodiphosphate synthase
MEENNFRKRQRTFSNETIFELLDISDAEDSTNDIYKDMQNLKIDKRVDSLLEELNVKMNNLSITLNLKIDKLSKMMTQLLDEKDYVIEHLKNEIELLKHEMKDTKRNIENNDYFC